MFEVLMKSDMGDEWEWVGVADYDAEAVHHLLGMPQRVNLKGKPMRHGEINADL